jgi:hypothetical protein
MKRLMIAVCLLLLAPSHVMACIEDHNTASGWFDRETARRASSGAGANASDHDWLTEVSLFAGGLGVLILVGVLFRATFRAAQRSDAVPFSDDVTSGAPLDESMWEPLIADAAADIQDQAWWSSAETLDLNRA